MTEPKEQAVPVVGVEEAVERLTRFTNGEMCAVIYAGSSAPEGGLFTDLRTILQAIQGSSFASAQDTHRATEQPVVGGDGLLEQLSLVRREYAAFRRLSGERLIAIDAALDKALAQQAAVSDAAQVGTSGASEPNPLPTVQAETAVVGAQAADEMADQWASECGVRAMAEAVGDVFSKWADAGLLERFHEQIEALMRQAFVEGVTRAARPDHQATVITGEQPGMSEGEVVAWFRQSRKNPDAWYQVYPHEVEDLRRKGVVVRSLSEPAPTLPDDLISLSEAATAVAKAFDVTGIPDWSDDEKVSLTCDGQDLGVIKLGDFRHLAAASVNFIRTLAARQNRAGETT